MRRTRIKRNEDGTFNLNIDLYKIDLKCLWHRTNQAGKQFLMGYDELGWDPAVMTEEEFCKNDSSWMIWNAIDEILEYKDMQEYDSNNEGIDD